MEPTQTPTGDPSTEPVLPSPQTPPNPSPTPTGPPVDAAPITPTPAAGNEAVPMSPQPTTSDSGPSVTHQGFAAVPKATISPDQPIPGAMVSGDGGNQTVVSPPKKKRFIKKIILPIVILVLLAGGSAAGYFLYYIPHQPQYIILSAFINMASNNKLHSADFNSSTTVGPTAGSKQTFSAGFNGSIGQGGIFDVKSSVDAYLTTITAEVLSPDGNSVYFKIGGLDGLSQILDSIGQGSTLQAYSSLINSINNQWYQINPSLVNEFKQDVGLNHISSLSSSGANKLESIYKKDEFLIIDKTFPSQIISGMSSYHYQVSLSSKKLQAFINAVAAAHISGFSLEQSELGTLNTELNNANISSHPFGIWVSKSDKFVDQLSLAGTSSGYPYSSTFTFTSFNQPVSVQTPANAKSILQLIGQISSELGVSGGSSALNLLNDTSTTTTQTQSL